MRAANQGHAAANQLLESWNEASTSTAAPPPLPVGTRIELHSLSRAELNGRVGVLESWHAERGRYENDADESHHRGEVTIAARAALVAIVKITGGAHRTERSFVAVSAKRVARAVAPGASTFAQQAIVHDLRTLDKAVAARLERKIR